MQFRCPNGIRQRHRDRRDVAHVPPDGKRHGEAELTAGSFLKYSGLAPGLVGVWQVNVQIPMATAPGNQVQIALVFDGNVADPDVHSGYMATVAIK
jgi:hypothetical protein